MATRISPWTSITTSPSPSPISTLGDDDLLIEILSRLGDTRSVWRCKSVCKRWNSLISTPYFSRRFVRGSAAMAAEPPLLISSGVWGPIWSFLPVPEEIPSGAIVVDCFEDLLLLGFEDWSGTNNRELRRSYLVCNPFTQQWVALPLAPERSTTPTARLVRKPSSRILELWDDKEPSTDHRDDDQFCVVIVYEWLPSKLDVFYSKSGRWGELALDIPIIPRRKSSCCNAVSCNGKLYWESTGYRGLLIGWNPFSLDDDYSSDDYHHISSPVSVLANANDLSESSSSIWVSQGVLHMIRLEKMYTSGDYLSVWRLKGGDWWERCCRASLKKFICVSRRVFQGLQPDIQRVVGMHLEKPEVVFFVFHSWQDGYCFLQFEEGRAGVVHLSKGLCTRLLCVPAQGYCLAYSNSKS